ncbi:unnamed protein product [Boreogadus saida]
MRSGSCSGQCLPASWLWSRVLDPPVSDPQGESARKKAKKAKTEGEAETDASGHGVKRRVERAGKRSLHGDSFFLF